MSYILAIPRFTDPSKAPPLDEKLYDIRADELEFFKAQTGIVNERELKQHILDVQKKAYSIYGYPCIRSFAFTRLKISRFPAYQSVLKLCHDREDAILLDIGCCFGNDIRKAVSDGWSVHNVIGSDIRQEFWDCGHDLFKSTPETFPAAFIAADAFDPELIAPLQQLHKQAPKTPIPPLKTLRSLTPLQGRVSAIHSSSLFHLFGKAKQVELAHRLATLLSPTPGSIIFGSQASVPDSAENNQLLDNLALFLYSPEGWRELWDGQIFEKGSVRVDAELRRVERPDLGETVDLLIWSVTKQ